jgi:hypothetical protein
LFRCGYGRGFGFGTCGKEDDSRDDGETWFYIFHFVTWVVLIFVDRDQLSGLKMPKSPIRLRRGAMRESLYRKTNPHPPDGMSSNNPFRVDMQAELFNI